MSNRLTMLLATFACLALTINIASGDENRRIGCFLDKAIRDLPTKHSAKKKTTQQYCMAYCKDQGLAYAGLQEGKYCFCGNSYGRYGKVKDSECRMSCLGDKQQTCGGKMRNEIFVSGFADDRRLGCFVDNSTQDLPHKLTSADKVTPHLCINYCRSKNTAYAGLQNGNQCFCGDAYGRYGTAKDAECGLRCEGDKFQTCGARDRNEIFVTRINDLFRIGCFIDRDPKHDLPHKLKGFKKITQQYCRKYCASKKFAYAGMQAGKLCFCGNSYNRYGNVTDDECKMECAGDPLQHCGSLQRNFIFRTGYTEARYVGCYADNADSRDLPVSVSTDGKITQQMCMKNCRERQFGYAGLQAGKLCFCGNSFGRYGKMESKECPVRCPGDASQMCGGKLRSTIMRTGINDDRRLGCFVEFDGSRELGFWMNIDSVNPQLCIEGCKAKKFPYAGLQQGRKCYCGDSYGTHGRRSSSDCDMLCDGDPSQTCGSKSRNEIFSTGYIEKLYIGCFRDDSNRDLNSGILEKSSKQTQQSCINLCLKKGFAYAGLQEGSHCYCGDSYGRLGKASESDCGGKFKCSGDSSQACGGHLRNSIFHTGISAVLRLGCYYEHPKYRNLPMEVSIDAGMNQKLCVNRCKVEGFAYAGLQFGKQCFCGDTIGTHGKANETECSKPCEGDATQMCGAESDSKIEVFRTLAYDSSRMGCFKDKNDSRDISGKDGDGTKWGKRTQQSCIQNCRINGYEYAGLQNGGLCFCGNRFGRYGKVADSECNMPCPGDSGQTCGGSERNEVFATGFSESRRVGCFRDKNPRDMPFELSKGSMTTRVLCILACRSFNYVYAGLQFGSYCFCGNSFGRYGQRPDGECNMPCSGSPRQTCGAGDRNEVFTTGHREPRRMGCYKDKGEKRGDLQYPAKVYKPITPQICINYCKAKGYAFAGLQNGGECYCGHKFGQHGIADDKDCYYHCKGDVKLTCGGALRNEVYFTGANTSQRLGCFKDSTALLDLPKYIQLSHNTPSSCSQFCRKKNLPFAGVQAKAWCFCGYSFGRYGRTSDSECNLKCAGDKTKTCGAEYRNEVYGTGVPE